MLRVIKLYAEIVHALLIDTSMLNKQTCLDALKTRHLPQVARSKIVRLSIFKQTRNEHANFEQLSDTHATK